MRIKFYIQMKTTPYLYLRMIQLSFGRNRAYKQPVVAIAWTTKTNQALVWVCFLYLEGNEGQIYVTLHKDSVALVASLHMYSYTRHIVEW